MLEADFKQSKLLLSSHSHTHTPEHKQQGGGAGDLHIIARSRYAHAHKTARPHSSPGSLHKHPQGDYCTS